MKTSAIALALLSCAAFASARAGGNDKSAGWPLDDQVLSNVLVSQLDCGAWAKNIDKRRPFFCDRSGVPKRDISEIDRERSKGYAWFGKKGADVLKKYEKWRAAPGKNAKKKGKKQ